MSNNEEIDVFVQKSIEFFEYEEEFHNFNLKMTKPCMLLGILFWLGIIASDVSSNCAGIPSLISVACIVHIVVLMFKD